MKAALFFWNCVWSGAMENVGVHAPFSDSGFSTPAKMDDAMGSAAATVGMAELATARQARNRRSPR